MVTENLHFSVGKNIGEVLLDIAQRKIVDGYPEEAINTYTASFDGCTNEYALMILKNQLVIEADDNGDVNATDTLQSIQANKSHIYDWWEVTKKWVNELDAIRDNRLDIIRQFDNLKLSLDIQNYNLVELANDNSDREQAGLYNLAARLIADKGFGKGASNGEDTWERLCDRVLDERASKYESALFWTVEYVKCIRYMLKTYMKFANSYKWLCDNDFILKYPFIEYTVESVLDTLDKFADTSTGYYHPICNCELYDFKEHITDELLKTHWGKEYLRYKILEKNIENGYDAGWLSPEGEFYGMIGETSDLMHLRLAESLADKLNINYSPTNPIESQLERLGWLKIHHNNIYGFFDNSIGKFCPSEKQIDKICIYAKKHYNGMIYTEYPIFGTRRCHPDPISVNKLKQMDEFQLHKIFSLY